MILFEEMMPFEEIKGFPGKVYVPETPPENQKKNPCPDCFFCQRCGHDRCQLCLNRKNHEADCLDTKETIKPECCNKK